VSTPAVLLDQASKVLQESAAHSNRAACWIARSALEHAVDDLLEAKRLSANDATMRSKLTLLQVAYEQDNDVPALADQAWHRLSQACHHHAFELAPSATEVQHLMQLVAKVVRFAPVDCPAPKPSA
jgi:hypothetical protein